MQLILISDLLVKSGMVRRGSGGVGEMMLAFFFNAVAFSCMSG